MFAGLSLALLGLPWQAQGQLSWSAGAGFKRAPLKIPAGGDAGFTSLPPSSTGIDFTNRLSVQDAMFNNNLMTGSGVAAGDVDGDGWCDLYFCAISGTNALYRNLGGWRFQNTTSQAGLEFPGARSTGAVFADVDSDGDLDLLVATLGRGVHLFLNDGQARFRDATTEAGLASSTGSTSLALADVNGDGTVDLYVANYGAISVLRSGVRPDIRMVNGQWVVTGPYAKRFKTIDGQIEEVGEPDVLYLNDGKGHFKAVPWDSEFFLDEQGKPKPEPWDYGLTVQMRDLNGDRAPEIYVCNDFQAVDRFWINDGTGRFRAIPRVAVRKQSFSSMGVDFGDLDRDGHWDFFVTEMMSRDHALRMRQVVGMQPMVPPPGRIESRPEVPRNTLFKNRGDNTFIELANYAGVAASDWSWQPIFLDVDLDGYEDILVGNGMLFDVQDRDVLNLVRSKGAQPTEQARTNLALYPPFNSSNVAYRNRGNFTFEDSSRAWGFDSTRISHSLAMADLDLDGDLDLAINCMNAPALLYRNNSSAARIAVRLRGEPPNRAGVGALIKVSGGHIPAQMQEILCGGHYLSGDEPVRVFAAGHPTNRLSVEVLWRGGRNSLLTNAEPNFVYQIDEASATAPAKPTAPTPPEPYFRDVSQWLGHTHHEELFNDFGRQPLLMKLLSQNGPGVACFDWDNDGRDELVIGTGRGGRLGVFRWTDSGRFMPVPISLPPAADDLTGLAVWVTADGRRCLVAGQANYELGSSNLPAPFNVFFLGHTGQVRQVALTDVPPIRDSVGPVAVADIDGDGDLDVFLGGRMTPGAYPAPADSHIFLQEGGRLVPDASNDGVLKQLGLVSGAAWSDLNGDGFPELLLACEWGPIRVFNNLNGRLGEATSLLGLEAYTGWWNGIATADLDEDGRLDIIASNWGLNTAYEASSDHPLRLYYGHLGGQGMMDLIESYFAPDIGAEVPRRNLNALSQAMPFLTAHYRTHAAFSKATMPDLLSRLPQQPRSLAATTLASMVFLNRGTNFHAQPLPAEAQFAPAFAVNVGDMDGDGHEDVFLSQNFFPMRAEWPRLDGGRGLWLRGDGQGRLSPVPGQESGVLIYGEQRGAALADFNHDARVDLVVAQNGAETRLFQNSRARPGLRIQLQGPPGNPFGIGAAVRLQSKSRFGPVREVRSGSGYWSQDSPVQILGCPERPARLEIRWPGGRRQQVEVPASAREIRISPDGSVITAP